MNDPTTLRALAARVVAEAPSRALDAEIAEAISSVWPQDTHYTTSRDAAASAMPEGWLVQLHQNVLWAVGAIPRPFRPEMSVTIEAPTEPQARAALMLLVRAREMESKQ